MLEWFSLRSFSATALFIIYACNIKLIHALNKRSEPSQPRKQSQRRRTSSPCCRGRRHRLGTRTTRPKSHRKPAFRTRCTWRTTTTAAAVEAMAQWRQRWHNCGVSTTFALAAEKRACTSMAGCGRWPNKQNKKIKSTPQSNTQLHSKCTAKWLAGKRQRRPGSMQIRKLPLTSTPSRRSRGPRSATGGWSRCSSPRRTGWCMGRTQSGRPSAPSCARCKGNTRSTFSGGVASGAATTTMEIQRSAFGNEREPSWISAQPPST